jgi:hypothetical protein
MLTAAWVFSDDRLVAICAWFWRQGAAGLTAMAEAAGSSVEEVVRLEAVAEHAIVAGNGSAAGFAERFRAALWERTTFACGVKSIAAYRFGLDFDPRPPTAAEVTSAAGSWRRQIDASGIVRIADPVLLRFLLWAGWTGACRSRSTPGSVIPMLTCAGPTRCCCVASWS